MPPFSVLALFADAEHPVTWVAVGSAAVTTFGSVALAFFAYLAAKDRNRLKAVEDKVEVCERKHAECEQNHTETKAELARARVEAKTRDDRDREAAAARARELQEQIDELKKQKSPDKEK
jgi:hypothetical protein